MDPVHSELIRRAHASVAWLLQDETIPGHIADHLTDALVDLGQLARPPHVPTRPTGAVSDPVVLLAGVRAELQSVIASDAAPAEILTLGRASREMAMAERELTGQPCLVLRETRDEDAAMAAIGR